MVVFFCTVIFNSRERHRPESALSAEFIPGEALRPGQEASSNPILILDDRRQGKIVLTVVVLLITDRITRNRSHFLALFACCPGELSIATRYRLVYTHGSSAIMSAIPTLVCTSIVPSTRYGYTAVSVLGTGCIYYTLGTDRTFY